MFVYPPIILNELKFLIFLKKQSDLGISQFQY
jgi:hypothetical protein